MLFAGIILVLACISVVWAWVSLRSELKKTEHVDTVKKDLEKGRVIFYSPSSADTSKE